MSFDKLIEIDFFVNELMKWISIQEIARLKCTSKKIQSKFTMEMIRPLLEENFTFRTLIFGNHLEIIEQIIPFKFNKRENKFPERVLSHLFKNIATQGKFSLFNKLISDECRPIFGFFDIIPIAKAAVENEQNEIVKFVISKFDWLAETGIIQPLNKVDYLSRFLIPLLISYDKTEKKEITKFLLSQTNLAKELRAFAEERDKISQIPSEKIWFKFLDVIASNFPILANDEIFTVSKSLSITKPSQFLYKSPPRVWKLTSFCEHFVVPHSNWIELFTKLQNESGQKARKSSIRNMWLSWYSFIDDFGSFNKIFTQEHSSFSTEPFWALIKPDGFRSPLYIMTANVVDFKVSVKYLDIIFSSLESDLEKAKLNNENAHPFQIAEFQQCTMFLIERREYKLLEKFIGLAKKHENWLQKKSYLFANASSNEDSKMMNWLWEHLHDVGPPITISQVVGAKDVKLANKVLAKNSMGFNEYTMSESITFGNIEFCKFLFEFEPLKQSIDNLSNWSEWFRKCFALKDEEMFLYMISLRFRFPTFLNSKKFWESIWNEAEKDFYNSVFVGKMKIKFENKF